MTDTRPNVYITWATTITASYRRVLSPDDMVSLGYIYDARIGEWMRDYDSPRDPADELAQYEEDDGDFETCERDVLDYMSTTRSVPDE